jgi:hypothetical protein
MGPQKVLADIEKTLRAHPVSADPSKPAQLGSGDFDSFFKKKPAGQ